MQGTLGRQRDEQILMALHLVDNMGLSHSKAADLVGMTKNACIGAINRVRNEQTGVHSIIRNPANKDRSQKPLWWFDPTSKFGQSVLDKIARLKQPQN
jgi:uracil phosphoribosyltransferase